MTRLALAAAFAISVFFAPTWVSILLGGVLIFLYPAWEVIAGACFIDVLYGTYTDFFFPFPLTASALLLFVLLHPFRSMLLLR